MADDAPGRDAALLALDWGSTTFRAWLLDGTGAVLDAVRTADGALKISERSDSALVRAAAFEETFARLCRPWLDEHPGIPVLCAGMAGSNHGWAEAGYLDVPADLGSLAEHLTVVPAGDSVVHIVPGLRATGADPDVIRGEEVQLAGTLATAADRPETVVLPGTHSKWVRLDGTRVTGFTTAMTGELYGLLMRDSILARLATGAAAPGTSAAFVRGLETEEARGDERGLPALLFTARPLVLAGRLDAAEVADYVSGLLIGAEVRHALRAAAAGGTTVGVTSAGVGAAPDVGTAPDTRPDVGTPPGVVALCGPPETAHRYRIALERGGASVRMVGEDVAARGLWRVALDAGLAASAPTSVPTSVPTPAAEADPPTPAPTPPPTAKEQLT